MCLSVLTACASVHHMCTWCPRRSVIRTGVADGCSVGAENQILVLCKNNKCSCWRMHVFRHHCCFSLLSSINWRVRNFRLDLSAKQKQSWEDGPGGKTLSYMREDWLDPLYPHKYCNLQNPSMQRDGRSLDTYDMHTHAKRLMSKNRHVISEREISLQRNASWNQRDGKSWRKCVREWVHTGTKMRSSGQASSAVAFCWG